MSLGRNEAREYKISLSFPFLLFNIDISIHNELTDEVEKILPQFGKSNLFPCLGDSTATSHRGLIYI